MLEAVLNFLCRQRIAVFALGIVAVVGGAVLASRLTVNDSPERWLPASAILAWDRFSNHFGYGDTVAVGLEFHRDLRDDDIEFLRNLRSDLAGIPEVGRVIDASLVAGEIEQVPLTELVAQPGPREDDPYEMYRGVLFDDPAVWRNASNQHVPGRTLVCFVELKSPAEYAAEVAADAPGLQGGDADAARSADASGTESQTTPNSAETALVNRQRRSAVAGIFDVLDEYSREDVTFHAIGGIVIQRELEKIARHIATSFLPICVVLTLVALGVGFRSLRAVMIVVLGGVWSVSVMLGGVSLAGWTLNVVTVGGPTLMSVLIIATAVHFSHYYSMPPHDDEGRSHDRRAHFVRWVGVPCLGASLTTGVGFLMLSFNELGPIRELGIELFAGAVLAFFGAFWVWLALPAFRTAGGRLLTPARLLRLEQSIVRRPGMAVGLILVVFVGLVVSSRRVSIDADPFSFFHEDSRISKAFDHFSHRKFGLYNLEVVLVPRNQPENPAEQATVRRKDREVANEFTEQVAQRPEVRNTISAISLGTRQRLLQLSLANVRRFLAFQDTFRNWTVDQLDQDAIRITFAVYDPGHGFVPLVEAMREALPRERFGCFYTGAAANVAALSQGLVGGISRGLGAALLVMALLCLVLFRSIRLTLISFLPNIFPVLTIFGVMGMFDVPLNSGSAMVSTVALGVALNDTVHFMMHYRRRRLEGYATEEAVADTFAEIGRPIVLTSIVTCFGFAIFLFSDFRPLYHFGMLASIAMAAALVGDLFMLPNLLKLFDRKAAVAQPVEAKLPETQPGS